MAGKRTYGDPCGIARALDVIGERWALLVVRELLLGPKRFTDLRAGLPHLGPDVLSQRLRDLEHAGVVRRATLPPPAGSRVYELTEWGAGLEPVVLGLGRWGSQAPFPPVHGALGVDALVLALKTLFEPDHAGDLSGASVELRLGDQAFTFRVRRRALEVTRGRATYPTATIVTEPATLQEVLWHGRPVLGALRSKAIEIDGERAVAMRFLRLFPLPVATARANR
jgi:DNA-binding HxlR family transcriptional regulator